MLIATDDLPCMQVLITARSLCYDRGDQAFTRAAPSIPLTLALPTAVGSRLRFLLAAYSLNGTYLGLQVRLDCALIAPRLCLDCA